jgi:hypothetical protein
MKASTFAQRIVIYAFVTVLCFQKAFAVTVPAIEGVNMQRVTNKLEALSRHSRAGNSPAYNTFLYPFKLITPAEFQTQKPADAFDFDAGFVGLDNTIYISAPTTTEQKAVFPDLTSVAVYYLCQSYLYHFYQTRSMPLIFKIGFPTFEADILPSDATIKLAVNAYGGSFATFDVLNNRATFVTNNGLAVAGAFAEMMSIYKNWGYPLITSINATGFDVAPWWFAVDNLAGLLADFNRYVAHRFLEPNENLRIKMYLETAHFKFYTRPMDGALNFPSYTDVCEAAYTEYATNFNVVHAEKVTFFTLPGCVDAEVEGLDCTGGRVTGGTAWSSGMHSTCASTASELPLFVNQNRHELAHSFQAIFPQGVVTSWLNEGFPSFCAIGPMTDEQLPMAKIQGTECMTAATAYFGHRPTYEETRIYPNPDYGYYVLGNDLVDFQYRKGGWAFVKAVQMNDVFAYQSIGYPTAQAFLDDFYFDFDIRILQKPIVTLLNPVSSNNELNSTVNISWLPYKTGVKLNVLVSTDEGKTWTEVATKTTGMMCNWNAGDVTSRFFLKFTAPDNLNVATTYGPFVKTNLNSLSILSPMLNNYVVSGDTTTIKWGTTNVQQIKVDYTFNDGSSWNTVTSSASGSNGSYRWVIPSSLNGDCKVRISDAGNASISSISETFKVVKSDEIGGPYLVDNNTLLLLHFDNDLNNRSSLASNAVGSLGSLTSEASFNGNMGNSFKTGTALSVPHHANLNLTGDWTIEAWVKLTSYNPNLWMYLFWKPGDTDTYQSNYSLEVNPWWGNVFFGYYFSVFNNRIGVTGASPALNEWYHVAYIRNTKTKMIQVVVRDKNRNLISLSESSYTPTETYLNSNDLQIGNNLSGYIDEVRISNVVRSFVRTDLGVVSTEKAFTIYPNPTTGKVQLTSKTEAGKIRIITMLGHVKLEKAVQQNEMLDLSDFEKGIYLIQLIDRNKTYSEKLILK